jgi:hypothetical protein
MFKIFRKIRSVSGFQGNYLGPVVEEGLIIGISIAALLLLMSIVFSVLDNAKGLMDELFNKTVFG